MVKKKLPPTPLTPEQAVAYMKRKKELASTRLQRARQNRQYNEFMKSAKSQKRFSFFQWLFFFLTGQWFLALLVGERHERSKREIELARLMKHRRDK